MTFLAPIYSSAWQDFYKPLAMMLLSEGRYNTQISSVPSERTDTLGIVLIPHHAKTSFCICKPHLGDNCFFPARDISWRITSKAKDVVTMTIHHAISHCGRQRWLECSFSPTRMLPVMYSSSPQPWPCSHALVSHIKLCHRSEKDCS